jgi:membrane protein
MIVRAIMVAPSLAAVRRYLERDLWAMEVGPRSRAHRLVVGALRLLVALVRALLDPQLNLEATALVYRTLLSIVPLLAVGFSVLKAFGADFKIEAVVARLLEPLGAGGAQLAAQVVGFVDNMQVSVLGAIGFVLLFYTVLSVIERIEGAFNGIWHVRRPRSLARKFSDYLSILLVGPVLVFGAFAIMAAAQNYWLVQQMLAATHLTGVSVFTARHGAPFVLLMAAFTLMYRLLPHTRVALASAFVGGTTAALLWHLAGFGFARFVASSTSYTAIYSGAAVFLISLVWLQLAWLIVLTGAQVAYVHQHPIGYVIVRGRPSLLLRERIGLAAMVEITRRYLDGAGPSQPTELARTLDAPLGTLEDVLEDFVASGLLVHTTEPDGVLLARVPDQVSVVDVLCAVREPPSAYDGDPSAVPAPVTEALRQRDAAVRDALGGVTLRRLASGADAVPPAAPRALPERERAA